MGGWNCDQSCLGQRLIQPVKGSVMFGHLAAFGYRVSTGMAANQMVRPVHGGPETRDTTVRQTIDRSRRGRRRKNGDPDGRRDQLNELSNRPRHSTMAIDVPSQLTNPNYADVATLRRALGFY